MNKKEYYIYFPSLRVKAKAVSLKKFDFFILRFLSFYSSNKKSGNAKRGPIPGSALSGRLLKSKKRTRN